MKNLIATSLSFCFLMFVSFCVLGQQKKAVLNHIALYVTDLKMSTAFYSDIIQLDTIPEPFHDGKHTWYGVGPKSHLHLIAGATQKKEHDKNVHLCFSVNSVDEFVTRLQKAGIVYEDWGGNKGKIQKRVDGVNQIWFRDPDGYWIEINDAKE
jgi:lactoylglutathione lyase